MISEIQPSCDIGNMLHNIRIMTLTKAQKRWRRALFSIYFSNTMLLVAKRLPNHPICKITPSPLYKATKINIPQFSNPQNNHIQKFSKAELTKLMRSKDVNLLQKFNGVEGIAKALHTTLKHGIMSHDIKSRKIAFGSNTYEPPPKGFLYFVKEGFKSITNLALLACAILILVFGTEANGVKKGWFDGFSTIFEVFLAILVGAGSKVRQERQFDRLSKISNDIKIDAIREGRRQKISISDVVVGDVIILNIGDQVPADGLFINGHSLLIYESSVTGESGHIDIDAINNPFLFSGSKVADGHGQMLVISVGVDTAWAKILRSITADSDEQTPLQSLKKVALIYAVVGLVAVILNLAVTFIQYCTGDSEDKNENGCYRQYTDTNDIFNSFIHALGASAEGLPLAVTLNLTRCMMRMMSDQAMIRKHSACETMGLVTVICTHKTGTLTMNQMEVTKFWLGLDLIENISLVDDKVLELYRQGIVLNTTGSVHKTGTTCEYSGSPTEKAILAWAVTNMGMNMEKIKQDYTILHIETFDSEKKRSGVSAKKNDDGTIHVHWKGAAEIVLAMCSKYYRKNGRILSIKHKKRTQLQNIIQAMAAGSLRCIAFAHMQNPADGSNYTSLNEEGLTLLGILGIRDPSRPGVDKAINACRSAGVGIKMITGDNVFTAKAIATKCGILEASQQASKEEVIEAEVFRNYTHKQRMRIVESIRVMARASPADKLMMVQYLKKKGHVVAVTGHGKDDAPSLKEADIGISIGNQGTEVAKNNSDIVILNDDFSSVVTALEGGRFVRINIQKFIQFQLTANVVYFVINFVKAASAGGAPFLPVQKLWANFIINYLGVFAFTTEHPTKELMHEPPIPRSAPLLTNVMWRNILTRCLYQIVILLTLEFKGRSLLNVTWDVKNTIIYNTFILCQAFNLFNSRKLVKKNIFEGLHKNWSFLGIVGVIIILQVVMVEYLNEFGGTEKLDMVHWGICIAIVALSLAIDWFVKLMPAPDTQF